MYEYIAKNMMNCKQIFIGKKKEKYLMRQANMIILTIPPFFSQTLLHSSHFAAMQTFYRPSSIIKKQMY